jgi:hypothetical protein
MGAANSLGAIALAFGLLCGSGVALIGLPANFIMVSEQFPSRVATAIGVAGTGMGIGVLLLIPSMQIAIERLGWREALAWSGLVAAIIIILSVAYRPRCLRTSAATGLPTSAFAVSDTGTIGLLLSTRWQKFAGANLLMGAAMFGLLTHQVAMLTELGWSTTAAAASLGVIHILRSASGPLWGVLIDRFGRRIGYGLSTAVAVLGIAAVASTHAMSLVVPIQTYAFILAFGLGSAGTLPTIATLGNDLFSIRERAVAWGFLEAAYAVGAALGAWTVGWLFDRSGDYFSSLCLVALSLGGSYFFVMALSPSSAGNAKLR